MSLIDFVVEFQKRRTIREIRRLMAALEDAIKEGNESKPDENRTTDRDDDASRHHTTA